MKENNCKKESIELVMPKPDYFTNIINMMINGTKLAFQNDSMKNLLTNFLETLFETTGILITIKPGNEWKYKPGTSIIIIPEHLLINTKKSMWRKADICFFLHEIGHGIIDFNLMQLHRHRKEYTTFEEIMEEEHYAWELAKAMIPKSENQDILKHATECLNTYTPTAIAKQKGWAIINGNVC